jgi:CheY-like chemotaxis protein
MVDFLQETSTNRILVVDDDQLLVDEYLRCLGEEFDETDAASTYSDLEKVLFGEDTNAHGAARFDVESRNQGEAAVEAVKAAIGRGEPFSIVFLDIRMPPGMDGIETARQIRELDSNVNIVIVTGSVGPEPDNLGTEIPPADKIFFFKKPFHALECRQLAAALCGKWHADMALRRANEQLEGRVAERTAALHKLAYYDPVTRLPNQLLLLDELEALVAKAEDSAGDTVAVLLDIERFSFINETMGYAASVRTSSPCSCRA